MDTMLKLKDSISEAMFTESTVDFPKETLCPEVWSRNDGLGEYVIREDVQRIILKYIESYPENAIAPITREIHIVGSITTNLYAPDSDIDVHIVAHEGKLPHAVKGGKIKSYDAKVAFQKAIVSWSRVNTKFIGGHQVQLYLQLNIAQDYLSDGVYNLKTDEWLKGPLLYPTKYNPYKIYGHVFDEIAKFAAKYDLDLGELKRDVIDYDVMSTAMEDIPPEARKDLAEYLRKKLSQIEADIRSLLADKKDTVEVRKRSSRPTSIKQALQDVDLFKGWADQNAVFKFLDRYQYIKVVAALEKLTKNDRISPDDIPYLKKLVGVL